MTTIQIAPIRDHHAHVGLFASLMGCLDLSDMDRDTALASMRKLPPDRVTTIRGWHSVRHALSPGEMEGLPPILLINLSLHGFALTPGAVERLQESDPEVVDHRFDPEWCERNLPRLLGFFDRQAHLEEATFDRFMEALGDLGVARLDEMLLQSEHAWRIMSGSKWADRLCYWTTPRIFEQLPAEAQGQIEGFKLFLDGAIGVRTAALSMGFRDGTKGLFTYTDAEWREVLESLQDQGRSLAIHAIGDLAIGQALDGLEDLSRRGLRFPSLRLEHVQFITKAQAQRAKALGIVLSMQPNFSDDSRAYANVLTQEACDANNPFRMLIDEVGFGPGVELLFGSDGMPYGVEAQLQHGLFPPCASQRLTLDELLAGLDSRLSDTGPAYVIDHEQQRVTRQAQETA
ncbi:MAG: amidohydrolase family protein [Firmicutes bacterium]|nr:amidohydrolase family protein [Bacillota bacterium]